MRNRTRRSKAGETLLDLSKYFATVTGLGSFVSENKINWKLAAVGFIMAIVSAVIGFWTIPEDKEKKS